MQFKVDVAGGESVHTRPQRL